MDRQYGRLLGARGHCEAVIEVAAGLGAAARELYGREADLGALCLLGGRAPERNKQHH